MERYRRIRAVGLAMFLAGGLGVPGFSLMAPGEELWKQGTRVAFLILSFVGVAIFAYGAFKINRSR